MKITLYLLISLLFANTTSAQTSFFPDWDTVKQMLSPPANSKIKEAQHKFKLISPSKDKNKGMWSVTCYLPNGDVNPRVNNLQVKEFHTGFMDYNLFSMEDKLIKVPVHSCTIFEN